MAVLRFKKYLNFKKNLHFKSKPIAVYRRVATILTNAITCMDYNQTSLYYNCKPMTLEQYFDL